MKRSILLVWLLTWSNVSYGTIQTDLGLVLSETFDRSTGSLYVGVDGVGIQKVLRCHSIYSDQAFKDSVQTINTTITSPAFLALSLVKTTPYLAAVQQGALNVYALTTDGSTFAASNSLLDASGTANVSNGAVISGIISMAAGKQFIFAVVAPNNGDFGSANGGIAVVNVCYNSCIGQGFFLNQTAAQEGDNKIKAKRLDPTTPEVGAGNGPDNPIITANQATLYYDKKLDRLYTGLDIATGASPNDAAFGVVVASVDNAGVMTYQQIAPASAFTAGADNEIVGAIRGAGPTALHVGIKLIRMMHTSPGPDYLIVSGGSVSGNNVPGNTVYALPIVNDPLNPTTTGTLANKISPVSPDHKFIVPATTAGSLPTSSDVAAVVGTRPLPLQPNQTISDMVVVGDTVYVSIDVQSNTNNDNGIFFSQALFDNTGKIRLWTPWSKKALINNPFIGTLTEDIGKVIFFEVDAVTGKIYAIGDSAKTEALAQTSWLPTCPIACPKVQPCNMPPPDPKMTFTGRVNSFLKKGSYSVLDLDQATRALGSQAPGRYALLGGAGRVIFLKTSVSEGTAAPFDLNTSATPNFTQAQTIITNYADKRNYLLSCLPKGSGCVTSLEFSRRDASQQNYFFAGTENGLFVFTQDDGTGFTLDQGVNDLNAAPFTTGSWGKVTNIPGSVLAVKTSGIPGTPPAPGQVGNGGLYVLTLEPTTAKPFNYTIYKIPFAATTSEMFAPSNIYTIAQSGEGDLKDATIFTDITIMSVTVDGLAEELVISTNHGLYRSNAQPEQATPQGIVDVVTPAQAHWGLVDNADTKLYTGLFSPDYPILQMSWPVQIGDFNRCKTFEMSNIMQLAGASDESELFNFEPSFFNAITHTPRFLALPRITYFYSDGARRFFVIEPQECFKPMRLMSLPYDTEEWNITNPAEVVIGDPTIAQVKQYYWVSHLGVTGILAAGTDFGVAVLQ